MQHLTVQKWRNWVAVQKSRKINISRDEIIWDNLVVLVPFLYTNLLVHSQKLVGYGVQLRGNWGVLSLAGLMPSKIFHHATRYRLTSLPGVKRERWVTFTSVEGQNKHWQEISKQFLDGCQTHGKHILKHSTFLKCFFICTILFGNGCILSWRVKCHLGRTNTLKFISCPPVTVLNYGDWM